MSNALYTPLMESITRSATVVASSDQVSSDLAGEAVILNLANGTYYGLNAVGARVWSLVQEPCLVSALVETLAAEYEVASEQCEHETLALLAGLHAEGLIKVC